MYLSNGEEEMLEEDEKSCRLVLFVLPGKEAPGDMDFKREMSGYESAKWF